MIAVLTLTILIVGNLIWTAINNCKIELRYRNSLLEKQNSLLEKQNEILERERK